jgi:DNA-binding transcriptional LysR family regulator
MSAYLLPQIIGIFLRSHPNFAVNVRSGTSRDIECLAEGFEIEVGVVTNPSNSSLLTYEPWQRAKLVAFVSEKHPWARKRSLSLEEFGTVPLIMMNTKTSLHSLELVKNLTRLGITPNIVMQSESPEGILMAVRSGAGLGICFREIVASVDFKCAGLKIIEVPMLDLTFLSFIIYPKNMILSDNAQAFLKILRRWRNYQRTLDRFLRAA